MNFILQRYGANKESTQGILLEKEGQKFVCHTIEDQPQEVKVKSETRIPAGFYELKIQRTDTPLTLKHRIAYNKPGDEWFKFHIEICNIKGFTSVYVHSGVNDDHSAGCLLLVDTIHNNQIEQNDTVGARSIQAVRRWYEKVFPYLDGGGKAFLQVRDEKELYL